MNFFKISRRNFSISTKNFLKKEFNLTKNEIKDLNNELKKSYVRPGWDKAVRNIFKSINLNFHYFR